MLAPVLAGNKHYLLPRKYKIGHTPKHNGVLCWRKKYTKNNNKSIYLPQINKENRIIIIYHLVGIN
jgi:hypothetical protein